MTISPKNIQESIAAIVNNAQVNDADISALFLTVVQDALNTKKSESIDALASAFKSKDLAKFTDYPRYLVKPLLAASPFETQASGKAKQSKGKPVLKSKNAIKKINDQWLGKAATKSLNAMMKAVQVDRETINTPTKSTPKPVLTSKELQAAFEAKLVSLAKTMTNDKKVDAPLTRDEFLAMLETATKSDAFNEVAFAGQLELAA